MLMPKSRTKPSTRRPSDPHLSQVARHVVIPSGIVTTGWPAVEAKCQEFGDRFDRWQADLGKVILGKRADGIYAATVGGVTLSIPRQVAKTWFVLRILFALCILFPGLKCLWTAHHTATLSNTFRSASGLARRKNVAPHIGNPDGGPGVRRGSGKEAILFKNGSAIYFGAREHGFGRGFEEVDVEVFDEAQILTLKALEDMVAATNQSRHVHGALLFYMGTPPRPADPGEVFTDRRTEALGPDPDENVHRVQGDAVYVECSADPDADPDDHAQWRKANPSFPKRTPLRSMLRLRKNLPDVRSWMREALGVWDASSAKDSSPVDADLWSSLARERVASTTPPTALAVDQWYDGTTAVGAAWRTSGGWHVEVMAFDYVHDNAAVVELLAEWAGRKIPVGVAGDSPAAAMIGDLRAAKVKVNPLSVGDLGKACVGLHGDVIAGRVTHKHEDQLDAAVAGARKAAIGTSGLWRWDRRNPDINLTPLMVVTIARFVGTVTKRKVRTGRAS